MGGDVDYTLEGQQHRCRGCVTPCFNTLEADTRRRITYVSATITGQGSSWSYMSVAVELIATSLRPGVVHGNVFGVSTGVRSRANTLNF